MTKPSLPTQFLLWLLSSLLLAFGLHLGIRYSQALPIFEHLIVRSYTTNALLAASIFMGLYTFRHRFKHQIGFLFMASSFLKLGVFFCGFYPTYIHNGTIDPLEFIAFFVPYSIALILETYFTTQLLKALEKTSKTAAPQAPQP